MQPSSRFLYTLLGIYAVLFAVLALHPYDRHTWFVENLTVWIVLALILGLRFAGVRFSYTSTRSGGTTPSLSYHSIG
jgi:putative membrane protein